MKLTDLIRKASRMDLTAGLFCRQISEKEIWKAIRGAEEVRRGASVITEKRYSRHGDAIIIEKTESSYRPSPNSSIGERRASYGFYPDKQETLIYDINGKLKERIIRENDDWGYNFFLTLRRKIKFNPPGRIIGEIVE